MKRNNSSIIKGSKKFSGIMQVFVNVGALLEYYDYLLFFILANILMQNFFPTTPKTSASLNFLFFTLAGFVKISGGLICGYLSDIIGRKKTILILSFMMALASLTIGIMPTGYSFAFYYIAFCIIRSIQAIAFGGEIPCATTFAHEHKNDDKKCARVSVVFALATVGSILTTLVLAVLTKILSMEQMYSWGWRIPFILGSVLGVFAFLMRKNLDETFITAPKKTMFSNLRENWRLLIWLIFMFLFPATLCSINIYFPTYLTNHFDIPLDKIYFSQTIALIFSILVATIIGKISKKDLTNKYIAIASSFFIMQPFLVAFLFNINLIWFMCVMQIFITTMMVLGTSIMLHHLPPSIRATGTGGIYNLAFCLANFVPLIFLAALKKMQDPYVLFYVLQIVGAISIISAIKIKRTQNHS